jgi:3-keto-5-aminohexanoate cleavage enzyme
MNRPVIITCAITGSVPQKKDNPAVPITVNEQVESTHEAYEAGASIVHIHVRDDDGKPCSDVNKFELVISGIKKFCPDIIIQTSTGGRGRDANKRGSSLVLNPDMASLATGSVNFPHSVYENSPDLIYDLAKTMLEKNIKPEIEIFDLSMIYNAYHLVKLGLIPEPVHMQFIFGIKNGLPAEKEILEIFIREAQRYLPKLTWTASGIGRHQIEIARLSLSLGGHIRTGLEDNIRLDRFNLAPSNAALVVQAANLCEDFGCSVANPREARNLLSMTVEK